MPKNNLGQHFLTDIEALEAIAEYAQIKSTDTVLEVGPGLGSLTSYLVSQAAHVVAVELDPELAAKLPSRVASSKLRVVQADIMKFELDELPGGYKVVANIPYYLTSNLLRRLSTSDNAPKLMVLLVQKEVAQRISAKAGDMSVLSVSVQIYYQTELGIVIPKELFKPKPKVDSQVVILSRHPKPIFPSLDTDKFFKVVRAGFANRRKKMRSSLAGGLHLSRREACDLLELAGIDPDLRPQNLSLKDWYKLSKVV